MIRKRVEWKFRGSSLVLGERTLIVGILNVTPDSFSDGGRYDDPDAAARRALEIQKEGADIIDIGAESTKPGSERIPAAEELRRLIPVLKRLKGELDIPISVDTYKPAVAEAALEHGASIINDVSGLVWEPDLAKTVRDGNAGLILSHTRGRPEEWARLAPMRDVMGEIVSDLEASVHRARRAGVELDHVVIDPGVGFGKRKEQNSELLARLTELRRLLLPILVGPSRKAFLDQQETDLLEFATAGAVAAAVLNGASLVRVHNVAAINAVLHTVDAIVAATPEPKDEEGPRRRAREAVREREQEETERKRPVRPPLIGGPKKTAEPPAPAGGERPAWSRPPQKREDERPRFRRDRDDTRPPRKRDEVRGSREGDRPRFDRENRPPRERKGSGPRGPRDSERPQFRGRREDDDRPGGARPPFRGPKGPGRGGPRGGGGSRGGGGPRGGGSRGPSTPRRRG